MEAAFRPGFGGCLEEGLGEREQLLLYIWKNSLCLGNMLSRYCQPLSFLNLSVQNSGVELSSEGRQSRRVKDECLEEDHLCLAESACTYLVCHCPSLSFSVHFRECQKFPTTGGTPCSFYLLCWKTVWQHPCSLLTTLTALAWAPPAPAQTVQPATPALGSWSTPAWSHLCWVRADLGAPCFPFLVFISWKHLGELNGKDFLNMCNMWHKAPHYFMDLVMLWINHIIYVYCTVNFSLSNLERHLSRNHVYGT